MKGDFQKKERSSLDEENLEKSRKRSWKVMEFENEKEYK